MPQQRPAPSAPRPSRDRASPPGAGRAWLLWMLLLFVVGNLGASRKDMRAMEAARRAGTFPPTPANIALDLRSELNDDADVRRYCAWWNAMLGRPFESYYVRSLDEWLLAFQSTSADHDPDHAPTIAPPAPLLPWRDFSVEYPPGFFVVTAPPALLFADPDRYRVAFGVWMGLLMSAALLLVSRLPGVRALGTARLVGSCSVAALLLGLVVTMRFDAAVALLLVVCLHAALARRPLLLGGALGLAVAAKLTPILAAPIFAIYLVRRRRGPELVRALIAGTAVIATVMVPAFLISPSGLAGTFLYHAHRPLQIESTGAALLGVLRVFAFAFSGSLHAVRSYGCMNVVGPGVALLSSLSPFAMLAGLLAVYLASWRRLGPAADGGDARQDGADTMFLMEGIVAAMVVFMVVGKVFSPQYLVWVLLPATVVALHRGRRGSFALLLLVLLLTQLIWPFLYRFVSRLEIWACAIVLARNLLLAAFAISILSGRSKSGSLRLSDGPAPATPPHAAA